jgi:NAD(P)-dependent dehydrogenase (short-subunit alcohol dehydrogenase family)
MSEGLAGRVVIVTGAGGGLGRSHALLLAERGAQVVVNDLGGSPDGTGADAGAAQVVVDEITAKGGTAVANRDSVSTPEGAQAIVASALDAFGRVDGVVNNAGILRDRSLAKMTPEDLELVLDVHLKGTIYVSQAAFPHMKEQGFGRFVHTSSAAGIFGNFGQSNYSAAKLGICGFSRTLAEEGARANITSNVIAPLALTRLTEELMGDLGPHLQPELVSPLVVALLDPGSTVSREVFSVGAGRYARVFTGLTPGWTAERGRVPSPDDVTEHLDQIMATDGFVIPERANDEIALVVKTLGLG